MKKCFLSILYGIISTSLIFAQSNLIGSVKDESGEPVPFATIMIMGTTDGTTTDLDGNFQLSVPDDCQLIFSSVGFGTQEVSVNGRSKIDIILQQIFEELEEVVVVGYGTVKKQDLTGSVAIVDVESINKFPVTNVASAIQGRLSGVQVVNSSEPGTNPQILVRGFGTIYGDPNPLVVIDGLQTGVGALSNIDPSAIESVQVLKDASAAAIYGSRAANGVIIITTKKGRAGSPQIQINSEFGVQTVANSFDLMGSEEYADYTAKLYVNSSTPLVQRNPPAWTQSDSVLASSTDWQDLIFRNALMQKHNINISGGGENSTYFTGLTYLKQEGVLDNSEFQRVNIQLNTEHKMGKLKIGESLNLFTSFKPENDLISDPSRLYEAAPQIRPYDTSNENGFGAPFPELTAGNNLANPLAYDLRKRETNTYGLLGNIYGEFTFFKGLRLRSDLNLDISTSDFQRRRLPTFQSQSSITRNDYELLISNRANRTINSETILNYNTTIGKHTFGGLIGYTVLDNATKGITTSASNVELGTLVPQTGTNVQSEASNRESRLLSQLARINYSYNDKYLLTASIRRDGSSNFGENNRFGVFPSFSVGWQVGNEDFMKSINWVSSLKVRGGYGELGRTLGNFLATLNSDVRYPWTTGSVSGVAPVSVTNRDLQWETVKQVNVGVDATFFDNVLSLTVDAYNRRSDDMIIRVPLPQYTGVSDLPWYNLGSMENKGVEVELGINQVISSKFDHQFKFNFTFNRNELTKLNNSQDTLLVGGTLTTIGQPVAVHYGWVTSGIDPDNGTLTFEDTDGNGRDTGNDRVVLGSPHPDVLFGFNYSAYFFGFDFSMFFQGVAGNQIFNSAKQQLTSTHRDRNRLSGLLIDAYDPEENPDGILPIVSLKNENNNDRVANRYVEEGDYLRLRNTQLGYTLRSDKLGTNISSIRVYASIINAFVITKYSGLDPDINNTGSVFTLANDQYRYPPVRSFNFGLQIKL